MIANADDFLPVKPLNPIAAAIAIDGLQRLRRLGLPPYGDEVQTNAMGRLSSITFSLTVSTTKFKAALKRASAQVAKFAARVEELFPEIGEEEDGE